jgi:uncharacterized protein (TIGR03435 family)
MPVARWTLLGYAAMSCTFFGQTGFAPAFDVASVKLSSAQERGVGIFAYRGGRITITNYTLKMLIHEAYGVEEFQITGGPAWAGEKRYSIAAMPPADSKSSRINPANPKLPPPDEELLMLRALLISRFHLAIHEEKKEGSVFALELGKQGSRLTPAKDRDAFPSVGAGRTGNPEAPDFMLGQNASMALFATRLARDLKRPVLDRTGLPGTYDFRFEYAADLSESSPGSSLFTAIQLLGLKLAPAKGPVSHVIVDRAEQPSEN